MSRTGLTTRMLALAGGTLMLTTTLAGAAPIEPVKLDVKGRILAYGVAASQDEATGANGARSVDILRDSYLSFTGETRLDSGLTIGAYLELQTDRADSGFDYSYIYASGEWGKLEVGADDGAAYLLQVAAPAADESYDGFSQDVAPVNYDALTGAVVGSVLFDYALAASSEADKLTYFTPVMSGFQAGASYTPDVMDYADSSRSLGVTTDGVAGEFGSVYEAALRYEGDLNGVGLQLGAGYLLADLESDSSGEEDRDAWNIGARATFDQISVGAVWMQDDNGIESNGDTRVWVLGANYTMGDWRLGASWYDREDEGTYAGMTSPDTWRATGGVTYAFGPGMTGKAVLTHIDHDWTGGDGNATALMLGTQITF